MRSRPHHHEKTNLLRTSRQIVAGGAAALIGIVGVLFASQSAHAIGTAVDLGTASSYSVLGGASVTNTGPSRLNADLGVSPGTAIDGFPPGLANGTTHVADEHALQAQADLTIAYDDAAGQAPDGMIADDIGGLTLPPGVYNGSSSIGLTGALTLDAEGDPDAVFVFQIGSTLTTATSSSVVLLNGARSCNVFWQIGSSATLGTGTDFVGNILALTSITADTGATVDGRALARNGSVTLDTNTFTGGTCATVPTTPPTETPTDTPTTPPTDVPTTPPTDVPTDTPTTPPTDVPTTPPTDQPTVSPTESSSGPTGTHGTPPGDDGDDGSPQDSGPPTGENTLPLTGSSVPFPLIAGTTTVILLGLTLMMGGCLGSRQIRR